MGDEQQGKEIASLNAKVDYIVKSIDELKTNYVQKVQFEDLKVRVDKLENAPHKTITLVCTIVSAIAVILAIFIK